ncbi:MAG: hypothetical protein K2K52_05225 [Paramuribaculum sp.]|nr:hypothetical protein [Paramuribaculum sp.]MDE6460220.1 hypothetical protein [Paramuribaculum sp.]MDE6652230.1 hypothetical protein [Paramuribaculum sp.]
MNDSRKKSPKNIWVVIGAVVLIILLIAWLTVAMFSGDTDVSAPTVESVAGAIMPLLP